MRPDDPTDDDQRRAEERRRRAERRRRRRDDAEDVADKVGDAADVVDLAGGSAPTPGFGGGGRGSGRCDSCNGFGSGGGGRSGGGGACDGCDCNLNLLQVGLLAALVGPARLPATGGPRLSTLLVVAAALIPHRAGPLVEASIRLYRRRLTRFTPDCPGSPSCSAYALAAVRAHGPRRGLRLAAARLRFCGLHPTPSGQGTAATASTSTS